MGLCLAIGLLAIFLVVGYRSPHCILCLGESTKQDAAEDAINTFTQKPVQGEPVDSIKVQTKKMQRKDMTSDTGALVYLKRYDELFNSEKATPQVTPDPNNPNTITTWWQAAAMMDWYMNSPIRYHCKHITTKGNWHICQDEPYTIKPPCLIYSFGIANDFTFDDAMAALGCEVHSFDPSMNMSDHKRGNNLQFHNLGIGSSNTDGFIPRRDGYVKDRQVWKMRTVKAIMEQLNHENRVIDVFKMDVEGYEWGIMDNMMETGVLKHIRQYLLEYHLFSNFPLTEEYVYLYKTVATFREMGFKEFGVYHHADQRNMKPFNNQGDCEYVNAFFEKQEF